MARLPDASGWDEAPRMGNIVCGMAHAGMVLKEFSEAAQWREAGMRRLAREWQGDEQGQGGADPDRG
jgi:hypothetical protein